MTYSNAVARWIAAGRPKRTDDHVAKLFDLCQGCPYFNRRDEQSGNCGLCGCRLSVGGKAMTNKLRMATESCPDGHW